MSVDLGCEQISASVQDSILRVAFNRPEKKNALTQDMYTALVRAIDMVDGTPELRALYITGEGPTFTSGNDVLDFMNAPLDMENSPVAKFLVAMGTMQKPFIAAVNGLAIGIGTTLLLHCEQLPAAEDYGAHAGLGTAAAGRAFQCRQGQVLWHPERRVP
jgi:enoyl-CoA hydratase/carnithine racemase